MAKIQPLNDENFVKHQYQNAGNLNARIRLHEAFSTNKYGWQRWLFDRIQIPAGSRVLELGCGMGSLWSENADRVPAGIEMTLSDLSEGMLAQAKQNLQASAPGFRFEVINAEEIPYPDHSFDVVIANHMLYHVPHRDQALREIRRVVKPDGKLYASTIGERHLQEMGELVSRFDASLSRWGKLHQESFNLENGAEILSRYFGTVSLFRYEDALVVTDARLLADYILSGRLELSEEQRGEFRTFVEQAVRESGGRFYATKDSGVFEAKN